MIKSWLSFHVRHSIILEELTFSPDVATTNVKAVNNSDVMLFNQCHVCIIDLLI